jgi:hypothetical protein
MSSVTTSSDRVPQSVKRYRQQQERDRRRAREWAELRARVETEARLIEENLKAHKVALPPPHVVRNVAAKRVRCGWSVV